MSQVNADLIADRLGTGPANFLKQWALKAWANLNGTGTIALRDSENVSSVTDVGTGQYTFNFINAMTNANYKIGASVGAMDATNTGNRAANTQESFAGSIQIRTWSASTGGNPADLSLVSMDIAGDLA